MAVSSAPVTVTTTATLLSAAETDGDARLSLLLKVPTGGATVFLGGSGVTTATGFPAAAGEPYAFDLAPGDALYGIVAASTQAVNVLRTGV